MTYDLSTLNVEAIKRLPVHQKPAGYQYQRGMGNGCFLDPPGFPTYFTRAVYNRHGNSPEQGPQYVIECEGTFYAVPEVPYSAETTLFCKLWSPLPEEHPRTQAWIAYAYQRFHRCYYDASKEGRDKTLIFPVPYYELRIPATDPRFKDEINAALVRESEVINQGVREHAAQVATPENHQAVRLIRQFYPAHQPRLDLIANPSKGPVGEWWGRYAVQPTPEECPGDEIGGHRPHPTSGSWCQLCGWGAP